MKLLNLHGGLSSNADGACGYVVGVWLKRGVRWGLESMLREVTENDAAGLESVLGLAVEIAHEGREGRHVSTLFTLEGANTSNRSLRSI